MPVVSYFCLQCLMWLIVVSVPKGHSWLNWSFTIQKGILGPIGNLWPDKACLAQKVILVLRGNLGPKVHLCPKMGTTLSWKGFHGPKGHSWPKVAFNLEREFQTLKGMARKGILSLKWYYYRPKRALLARKGICGSKGHLLSIISNTVSDRQLLM